MQKYDQQHFDLKIFIMHILVCIWGVAKKLEQLAKQKDCEVVREWVKSISNHLFWSAASSDNGDLMVAKWKSIANHLQDINEGHSDSIAKHNMMFIF